jgi:hypothetical protein
MDIVILIYEKQIEITLMKLFKAIKLLDLSSHPWPAGQSRQKRRTASFSSRPWCWPAGPSAGTMAGKLPAIVAESQATTRNCVGMRCCATAISLASRQRTWFRMA